MTVLDTVLISVLAAENAALVTYFLVVRRVNNAMSEFMDRASNRPPQGMYLSKEEAAEVQRRRSTGPSPSGAPTGVGAYL